MKGDSVVREIQIKNFRSLKDTGLQRLTPITVLVGENSSGKSTFLRAFPLLKQSISKRTSGPILWAGDVDDYVDFGSFRETVTNDGSSQITFKFCFELDKSNSPYGIYSGYRVEEDSELISDDVSYEITIKTQEGNEFVSFLTLQINQLIARFDFINNTVQLNDTYTYESTRKVDSETDPFEMRNVRSIFSPRSYSFGFILPDLSDLWKEIYEKYFNGDHSRYDPLRVLVELGRQIATSGNMESFSVDKQVYEYFPDRYQKYFSKIQDEMSKVSDYQLQHVLVLMYIYAIFPDIDEYISEYFKNVHYIAPLRATAERYYRLRNLAVDEVDFQGKNLAIFINSLKDDRKRAFKKWTNKYFGFSVDAGVSEGHISLKVKLKDSDKTVNLSDTGFGYSQVLPIITQIWELSSKKVNKNGLNGFYDKETPLVIAIEQPELHLHPAVQARLANAFIACINLAKKNGRQLQIILETHSETIINYFGSAVANNKLSKDDVSIVLFERDFKKGITNVRNSGYDSDGYLLDWPYGFFDAEV